MYVHMYAYMYVGSKRKDRENQMMAGTLKYIVNEFILSKLGIQSA